MTLANVLIFVALAVLVIVVLYFTMSNSVEYYSADTDETTTLNQLKTILVDIDPRFKILNIFAGNESLTINKQSIYICIKNPRDNTIYPLNLLLYIALHEIAHTMSETYSLDEHNEEFQSNFGILLDKAAQKGYSLNGLKIPSNYCKSL